MDTYNTIAKESNGEYKENKSRFIGYAYSVDSIEQVKQFIDNLKNKYYDARHHCYAYRIGMGKESVCRTFDDREPSHTAGDMILSTIDSKGLTNVLVVVVRYFGGIKLGASNLAKAYRQTAENTLENAVIIQKTIEYSIIFKFPYTLTSQINKFLKENNFTKQDTVYMSFDTIKITFNYGRKEKILNKLNSIFGVEIL